jgi:hypothetical protein
VAAPIAIFVALNVRWLRSSPTAPRIRLAAIAPGQAFEPRAASTSSSDETRSWSLAPFTFSELRLRVVFVEPLSRALAGRGLQALAFRSPSSPTSSCHASSRAAEHVSPLRPVRASRSSARCSPAVGATPTTRVDCRGRSSGAPRATGNRRFTWPVFFTTNVEHTSTATAVGSPTRSSWGRCRRWSLLGRSATDSGSRRFRHRAGRLGPHRERPRENRRRVEHARRFASARGRREHVPTLGRARGAARRLQDGAFCDG